MARLIATKSPVAVSLSKQVLNYSRDHCTADGLEYVATTNGCALQSEASEDLLSQATSDTMSACRTWRKLSWPLWKSVRRISPNCDTPTQELRE
jgi:hypothetical protein